MTLNKLSIAISSTITGLLLTLASCEEVGPQVNLHGPGLGLVLDTAYTETPGSATPKNVVIEEYTGVKCINCAYGHQEVASIIQANPGRVFGVAMHSKLLDDPFPTSRQKLTTNDANDLENFLGSYLGKPAGAINREVLGTQYPIIVDYADWSADASAEMAKTTPVRMTLASTFNSINKELIIDVEAHYSAAMTEGNNLSIFLTEDSIVTTQLLPDNSENANYVHDNVYRYSITNLHGNRLNYLINTGIVVKQRYRLILPANSTAWRPEKMHIVAFVHKYQSSKEILQSISVPMK